MANNLLLALQIKAQDFASGVVQRAAQQAQKAAQATAAETKRSAQVQQQAVQQTAQISEQAARVGLNSAKQVAAARQALGVRSEHAIQRELQRTVAQYNRLARSGVASSRELARAQEQVRNKVRELNAEMGKTPTGQRLGNLGRGAMGVAAGATAGAMMLREPVRKSMGYDRDLAMVANTAFSDEGVEGRIAGKQKLHNAVKQAVSEGGGTKEEALGALDKLLASGTVKADTAMALLPTLQKAAVATGSDTNDIASIIVSALQNGIAEADIGKALDMAVAAGQAGNFELKDMAAWLPKQMAVGKQAGLSGLEGFKTLLVANQQARVTAGTSDEAGNNLVNLLGKLTSKETVDRFEKLEYTDKKGKKRTIDYAATMESYKMQGKNSLEAFMSIMDDVVGNDKNYQALQEKLKTANDAEQKAILDQMTNFVEGTAIGQIISDREALMALLGIRNNVKLGKEVDEKVTHSDKAVDTSQAVIKASNDYKVESLKSTAEFAQMESMAGFNNLLGSTSETLTEYAKQYPELTTALAGAATGIGALGAAAMAAAGSIALFGSGKGEGLLPEMGGGRGRGATANSGGGRWRSLGKGLGFVGKVASGIGVVSMAQTLGEQAVPTLARSEAEAEKNAEAKRQFGQTVSAQHKPTAGFNYGGSPLGVKSNGAPLYGGYALAHLQRDNEIGQARLSQGTYTPAQAEARVQRNQQTQQQLLQAGRFAPFSAKPVNEIASFAQQLSALSQAQGSATGQADPLSVQFPQYHAQMQTLATTLPQALQSGLSAQQHTIDNRIVVELDGRVVAEQVSQHFFNFANRGSV